MKLLIATPSPFARKVRVFLRETKLTCEELTTNPWSDDDPIGRHNPLGKIPILMTDDGKTIFDSCLIVEYLQNLQPEQPLIPEATQNQLYVKQIEKVADGICDAAVLTFLECHRPIKLQSHSWISRQEKKILRGLTFLNRELNGKEFFTVGEFTVGDISVGCALSYLDLRLPTLPWRDDYGRLKIFSASLEKRKSFRETLLSAQPIPTVN
jgi:glutathione S-transferase